MVEHGAWSVERAADLWELRARASEWERSQHEHDPTISTLELGTKEQGRRERRPHGQVELRPATGHRSFTSPKYGTTFLLCLVAGPSELLSTVR